MYMIYILSALLLRCTECAIPTNQYVSNTGSLGNDIVIDSLPSLNLHRFGDHLYYFGAIYKDNRSLVRETLFQGNYYQAMQFCNLHHMELVSIETKEENDFLWAHLKSFLAWGEFWFWSSGTTMPDNHWVWMSTGLPIRWANWFAGQPDNAGNNEKCLELRYLNTNDGLKWNDHVCTELKHVICETTVSKKVSNMIANTEILL